MSMGTVDTCAACIALSGPKGDGVVAAEETFVMGYVMGIIHTVEAKSDPGKVHVQMLERMCPTHCLLTIHHLERAYRAFTTGTTPRPDSEAKTP